MVVVLSPTCSLTYAFIRRRQQIKKSCQDLGLYKMKSVSKKKLQTKIKKVTDKLNAKNEAKVKLKSELNDAKNTIAYWEDRACTAEQKLTGKVPLTRAHSMLHACIHCVLLGRPVLILIIPGKILNQLGILLMRA